MAGGREINLGVTVEIDKISSGMFILTKKVFLNPRMVIVNSCVTSIEWRQSLQVTSETLQPEQRMAVVWSNYSSPKKIQVKLEWGGWSDGLDIS